MLSVSRVSDRAEAGSASKRAGLFILAVLLLAVFQPPATADELDPAFRLPIGGRALAGPLVDSGGNGTVIWILSEDKHLYLLSESGKLLAHPQLEGKPLPLLALDSSGRALVCCEAAAQSSQGAGPWAFSALTRTGRPAYRLLLSQRPEEPPVSGADGRLYIACAKELLCLAANGRKLWTAVLTSPPSSRPCVDALGRLALGLEDGRLLFFSPYGELLTEVRPGKLGALAALSPVAAAVPVAGHGPVLAAGLESGRIIILDSEGSSIVSADCGPGPVTAVELCPPGSVQAAIPPNAPPGSSAGSSVPAGANPAGSGSSSVPAVSIALLCANGRLSVLSFSPAGTPQLRTVWQAETALDGRAAAGNSLYIFQHRIIVTVQGGAKSYTLEGELRAEATFKNSSGAAAPSPQGLLFSPGEDWILGAYRFVPALGNGLSARPARYAAPSEDEIVATTLLFDPEIGNPSHQLALIQDIETKIAAGSLGSDEDRAARLSGAIARGRFQPSSPEPGWMLRDNPLPRARAASVLGEIGSPDSIDDLLAVLGSNADASIKAAAVRSLGEIGLDPDNRVGAAFEGIVEKNGGNLGDELALALIEAIESIASRSGGAPDLGLVRALIALSSAGRSATVRNRANKAVSTLIGG